MTAVAHIFDANGDGFIDYCEFVSALHPNRDPQRRGADADRIQDEVCGAAVGRGGGELGGCAVGLTPVGPPQVNRQVAQCNCAKRFQVEQISANRYRVSGSRGSELWGGWDTARGAPGTETPIIGTGTPIMGTETPIIGTETPIMGIKTPIMGSETPIMGTKTPIIDTKTPIIGTETPIMGSETPIMGTKSPIMGSETPIMGIKTQ